MQDSGSTTRHEVRKTLKQYSIKPNFRGTEVSANSFLSSELRRAAKLFFNDKKTAVAVSIKSKRTRRRLGKDKITLTNNTLL